MKRNPRVLLATTRRGGHLAFYQGLWAESWAERATLQFLELALEREATAQARWQGGAASLRGNRTKPAARDDGAA